MAVIGGGSTARTVKSGHFLNFTSLPLDVYARTLVEMAARLPRLALDIFTPMILEEK